MTKRQFSEEETEYLEEFKKLYEEDVRLGRDQIRDGRFMGRVIDEVIRGPHSPDPDQVNQDIFDRANEIIADIKALVLQQTGVPWDPVKGGSIMDAPEDG